MIYLDHHAATPLAPGVADAMREAESRGWANPSSVHGAGRAARALLEHARGCVARALGAEPADVVLTSGGTEACDLAVAGSPRPTAVITWAIAHPAVLGPARRWGALGVPVTELPALVSPEVIPEGSLVILPWVSHETGSVLDAAALTGRARASGARVVVDANQALGRVPIDVGALDADAVAIASHKVGGPAGAGALWVRRSSPLEPRLVGGSQERGRRAGSPSVSAIVGFGAACDRIESRLAAMPRVAARRDRLEERAVAAGAVVNGMGPRVASVSNVSFRGWRAEHLVAALDLEGVMVSAGAACSSGLNEPSPTVAALHPDEPWRARSAIRLSLGPCAPDDAAVDQAAAIVERVVARGGAND